MAPKTPIQEHLVAANEKYAASYTKGGLALPPAKKYAILTCMDARLDPAAAYGIDLGDAHVIRNAGGNARDAIRSLVISEQLLGTKEIILIKHTGCGMMIFDNDKATELVKQNLGAEGLKELESFHGDFQTFTKLEESVKEDVEFLKKSPLIPKDITITGWIYEVETGKVRNVV